MLETCIEKTNILSAAKRSSGYFSCMVSFVVNYFWKRAIDSILTVTYEWLYILATKSEYFIFNTNTTSLRWAYRKNQLTVTICLRCGCSLKWIIVKWIGNARACKLVLSCRLPLSHIAGPGWLVSWTPSTIPFLTCQVLSLKVNSVCVYACDEMFCARLSMWLVYSSLTGLHGEKSP